MSEDEKSMIAAIAADQKAIAERQAAFAAKQDMMFVLLEQIRQDGKSCRAHCDKEMPEVHDRITQHIREDHKFNPVWVVAAAGLVTALIALLSR